MNSAKLQRTVEDPLIKQQVSIPFLIEEPFRITNRGPLFSPREIPILVLTLLP